MLTKKLKGQFIAEMKIDSAKLLEKASYFKNNLVEITFIKGSRVDKRAYLESDLERIVTKKQGEASKYAEKFCFPIIESIIAVLAEHNLTTDEVNAVLGDRLTYSIQANEAHAVEKMWKKKMNDITLMDVQNKLIEK